VFGYLLNEALLQYAPVSGTIEKINDALGGKPGLMSSSPEENGEYFSAPNG